MEGCVEYMSKWLNSVVYYLFHQAHIDVVEISGCLLFTKVYNSSKFLLIYRSQKHSIYIPLPKIIVD